MAGVAPVAQHQPVLVPALAARAARHLVQVQPVQRVAIGVLVRWSRLVTLMAFATTIHVDRRSSRASVLASEERYAARLGRLGERRRFQTRRRVPPPHPKPSRRYADTPPGRRPRTWPCTGALRLHLGPAHDARHAEKMRAAVQPAAVRDVVLADDAHVAEHQSGVGGERGHREPGRRARAARRGE